MTRESARPRFADLDDMVTPEQGAAFLGVGRNTMYELLKGGVIRHVRYGRLIRIPKAALLEPVDSAPPALKIARR